MSSSKFKVIENKRPDANNLVIVVNKAGQVSTDTELLQNLLSELNKFFQNFAKFSINRLYMSGFS